MKSSPQSAKRPLAFTLIELLVVIAIIAILIGLLFPAFNSVKQSALKVVAKNDETQIVNAIKAYYTEYGKYPVSSGTGTATDTFFGTGTPPTGATSYTNDVLFDVLRNNTASTTKAADGTSNLVTTMNPRAIVFLDVPFVKSTGQPTQGIMPSTASSNKGAWYDPWGSQYNVLVDSEYGGTVVNPYAASTGGGVDSDTVAPGGANVTISGGAIVWSYGKNGKLGGGAAATGFTSEPGTARSYRGSADVISWQ